MDLDLPDYIQFAVVLVFVLGLIFLLTWILRRFTGMGSGQATFTRKARRLGIIEGATLGGRHRLILIRRDNVEHLLLVGGATDLVVETGITPPLPIVEDDHAMPQTPAENEDHIEPTFTNENSSAMRDNELAQSKALLDRLSKRNDET